MKGKDIGWKRVTQIILRNFMEEMEEVEEMEEMEAKEATEEMEL